MALLIASGMSVIGVEAWRLVWPTSKIKTFELVFVSCLTWAILGPRLYKRSLLEVIIIGLLSPVVGSIIACTKGVLSIGVTAKSITILAQMVLYALVFIWKTGWITFPVGVITALMMNWVWKRWPPNQGIERPATQ